MTRCGSRERGWTPGRTDMAKKKKAPELTFQQHIADYLIREHKYAVLEQTDITDTEHYIAEDQLWAFLKASQEIDFVFYLNGLPIVALELKHEANQNVHDAVAQFTKRDHTHKIFQHPFLYLAADTSDAMAATDPRKEDHFRWHNMGLTNTPTNPNEYPVEFLYREVLSQDQLLEALSFFLVRVPEREAEDDKPARPASTIFPRYHQSRLVRRVAEDITTHFATAGDIGKKYLADHSAGSGKTLSICWLADRLHSLFKPGTNEKLVDITFVLTDRKSLDTNIREDIEKFTHLKDVVGIAHHSDDLPRFLKERKSIIVTTQQKFAWVLEEIQKNPELKKLRVAFLIDEAHRSQEGQMGAAIRLPFRKTADEPDIEEDDEDLEEQIARIIREHDLNQLFVAFTATPSPATVSMFGKPFDSYTEAEAIAEGYIVDVAASIISYKTLYNLHCPIVPKPDEEKLYIKQVTEEKIADPAIRNTVQAHRDDRIYLEGPYRGQVNGDIQTTYDMRGRYDELTDPKYTDTGPERHHRRGQERIGSDRRGPGEPRRDGHHQGDATRRRDRVCPPPHQTRRRENHNPRRPAATRPPLRRPQAGTFPLRQHQRRERDSEHPRGVDWPDRPQPRASPRSLRRCPRRPRLRRHCRPQPPQRRTRTLAQRHRNHRPTQSGRRDCRH